MKTEKKKNNKPESTVLVRCNSRKFECGYKFRYNDAHLTQMNVGHGF